MKIGIDISQLAYQNTGVANYLGNLVKHLLKVDKENKYILFYSNLRGNSPSLDFAQGENVTVRTFKFPPSMLDLLWNRLHIMPIEDLIGDVDVFISSDWAEPPTRKAKKLSILYDLIAFKYPEETHNQTSFRLRDLILKQNIVNVQKRKLAWMKKETSEVLCISEATKKDAIQILGIEEKKLRVVYPGV